MKNKICPICEKEFMPTNNRQIYCLGKCSEEYRKEYLINYTKINKKKKAKYLKEYCKTHKKERQNYYRNNIENIKVWYKKYYQNNKQKLLRYAKEYRETHKIERSNYQKNRLNIDVNFKLVSYLRNRIVSAIKGNTKSETTTKLLGCPIEFFKSYYESKFTEGMSWEKVMNGEIHCDHIISCASFDLSKPEEQYRCFHYTNLQPLWAIDNIIKKDKIC